MAVALMHLDNLLNSKLNVRMGKGFSLTTISRVYKEWREKGKKHPVCVSPVGENALSILEVRGEWAD